MKYLIVFIFNFWCICIIFGQNENVQLNHSYLQGNIGVQYNGPAQAYGFVGEVGYFVNLPKFVLGGSMHAYTSSAFGNTKADFGGAQLHIGKYLSDPRNDGWNVLVMSGLAYHRSEEVVTSTRTGSTSGGDPIWSIESKGGDVIALPISIELQTNKISNSGTNLKFETLIDTQLEVYFLVTVGANINIKN